MLQFIAPLVHAHAGDHTSSHQGLHVPGLEHYSAVPNTLIAQMETLQYTVSAESMIIGIETGLKQNQADPQTNSDNSYYLHQQTVVLATPASRLDVNFSPQPKPPVYRLFTSSLPPRAPPAE